MVARRAMVLCFVTGMAMMLQPAFAGGDGGCLADKLALKGTLHKEISCNFEETPLTEVLDFFRTTLGANVVSGLPKSEIEDKLITLQLTDVPADRALKAVLRQVNLDYGFAYGAIYVSTPRGVAATRPLYLKSYNINDLIVPCKRKKSRSKSNSNNSNNGNGNGRRTRRREVLALITVFTRPCKWSYMGTSRSHRSRNSNGGNRRRPRYREGRF